MVRRPPTGAPPELAPLLNELDSAVTSLAAPHVDRDAAALREAAAVVQGVARALRGPLGAGALITEPVLSAAFEHRATELALRLVGVPPAERRPRAGHWLESVGLGGSTKVQPHELSAGMRQRAQLARALACDPDVVLGDEPFGQLDAQARELLQNEIQRVWEEREGRPKTYLFVTHNVREAALLADRVLVLSAAPGHLLEEVRISAPRPRQLDDVLVARVVTEVHELLMREVDKGDGA